MGALNRESILAINDMRIVRLKLAEWGGEIYLRSMTSLDRDDWEGGWHKFRREKNGDIEDQRYFRAFLACYVISDETGNRLFTVNDVPALAAKSAKALAKITTIACKLNGIGDDEVLELAKNYESGQSE